MDLLSLLKGDSEVRDMEVGELQTFLDVDDSGEVVVVLVVQTDEDFCVIECTWNDGGDRAEQTFAMPMDTGDFTKHKIPIAS